MLVGAKHSFTERVECLVQFPELPLLSADEGVAHDPQFVDGKERGALAE